jgi:predicted AAA+ superfamily ATPase
MVHRYIEIHKLLTAGKSVLLLGPRGTGKSYFIKQLAHALPQLSFTTIDLLNSEEYLRYSRQPHLLFDEALKLSREPTRQLIVLDEVQRIPQLLNEVHRAIETFQEKVTFLLTGSSARKLKTFDANLLAGRAISLQFFPFCSLEIDYHQHLQQILQFGTLPAIFNQADSSIKKAQLTSYVSTYLIEEIQREAELRNLEKFSLFLETVAVTNGTPINLSKLARAVGTTHVTIGKYYELLTDTLLAYKIPSWTHSPYKKITHAAKYYIFDNGVTNALTGMLGADPKEGTNVYGKWFESLVIIECITLNKLLHTDFKLYHYREHSGAEVDLVLQRNAFSKPIALEIKSSSAPSLDSLKGLQEFKKHSPQALLFVLCRTPRAYEQDGIQFLPFPSGIPTLLRSET